MKTKKARESSAKTLRRIGNAKYLYLMLLIPVPYVVIFNYIPIGGIAMAFQRYTPRSGMFGSEWVGLYNFARFFESPVFLDVIRNTLSAVFPDCQLSLPHSAGSDGEPLSAAQIQKGGTGYHLCALLFVSGSAGGPAESGAQRAQRHFQHGAGGYGLCPD